MEGGMILVLSPHPADLSWFPKGAMQFCIPLIQDGGSLANFPQATLLWAAKPGSVTVPRCHPCVPREVELLLTGLSVPTPTSDPSFGKKSFEQTLAVELCGTAGEPDVVGCPLGSWHDPQQQVSHTEQPLPAMATQAAQDTEVHSEGAIRRSIRA